MAAMTNGPSLDPKPRMVSNCNSNMTSDDQSMKFNEMRVRRSISSAGTTQENGRRVRRAAGASSPPLMAPFPARCLGAWQHPSQQIKVV